MTIRIAALSSAALLAAAQTPSYVPPAPVQPLPFSHKVHVSKGLACKDCHVMPEPGDKATFPATAKCMECHVQIKKDSDAIQKLAGYDQRKEPIPWKRVYHVPDYVSFSHKVHVVKAQVACETCHGRVSDSDVMRKEKETSMAVCMDCHKTRSASVACDFCHEQQ